METRTFFSTFSYTPRSFSSLDFGFISIESSSVFIEFIRKDPWDVYRYCLFLDTKKWYRRNELICCLQRTCSCISVRHSAIEFLFSASKSRLPTGESAIGRVRIGIFRITVCFILCFCELRVIGTPHLRLEFVESCRDIRRTELIEKVRERSIYDSVLREVTRKDDHEIRKCQELIGHFIHLASCPVHEKFWKPSDSTIFHFYDIPCCQRFRTVESDLDLRARSAAITDTQKWSSEITCPSSTIRERGIGTHETRRTWISEIREDIIS